MKKEIVIVTNRQGAIAVPATIVTHPHPTIGEVGIHKTVGGRDWSITHVRTGRRFLSRTTRKAAIAWAEDFSLTEEQTEILKRTESAPPLEEANPLPKPEPKTRPDIDAIVDAVNQVVTLSDRERKAVRDALSSRSGRLKASAPVESWAKAAWNGLQPNPWKIQIGAMMFLPDEERSLLNRLSKHTWPVALDKDIEALSRMGVA